MVLGKRLACLVLLAACNQSLFDNGHTSGDDTPPGDGGTDAPVATACEAPCVADAAADFDGTATGATQRWRYLDDKRDRTWTPMSVGPEMTGAGMNAITSCANAAGAAACSKLPGALLVTSSSASSAADPAIELTVPAAKVLRLTLRVHVPEGGRAQVVRLYRSSREDALYTGTATPDVTLDAAVTVDALANERFLLALAPSALGTERVGVQLFVSETGEAFPRTCQLAVGFEQATGNTVPDGCKGAMVTFTNNTGDVPVPPVLAPGPFAELGLAAAFVQNRYYDTTTLLDRSGDSTMQLWFQQNAIVDSTAAWILSDLDLDDGQECGGIGIAVDTNSQLLATSCANYVTPDPVYTEEITPYPSGGAWHFIRVSSKGNVTSVCLDGEKKFELAIPAGSAVTSYVTRIGRNSRWTPTGSYIDGKIDDVRLFTEALPCGE